MREEITLSNGIVVRDLRDESRGIQVTNTNHKFVFLYYTRARCFHLNVRSIIGFNDMAAFGKEFMEMSEAMTEAVTWLGLKEE